MLALNRIKVFIVIFLLLLTGCASSSDMERRANNHAKAGNYYQSIGQPGVAQGEYSRSKKAREDAEGLFPFLVELVNLLQRKSN